MSYLDRLNVLVAQELDVPFYRKTVDRSGHNLTWLRKAAKNKPISEELKKLLAMEISELVKV